MKRSFLFTAFVKVAVCITVVIGAVIANGQSDSSTPATNSRLIFVSPDGSDANTGFAPDQAVQTVEQGFALLRNGSSDWLLLQRGHNYALTQTISRASGASENAMLVITTYGQGQAPELHVGPNSSEFEFNALNIDHVLVRNVALTGLVNPFPVLQPGNGWVGPTPEPDPVGNSNLAGFDAKAIARWDVVPYQTFDNEFHIGVVAFHINGIDRVDFSVDSGPWTPVTSMIRNPRTNVWEYTAILDASLFPSDGLVEVRAIVWPRDAGEPRVLQGVLDGSINHVNGNHSVFLNANAGGSFWKKDYYVSWISGDDTAGDGSLANPFKSIGNALRQGRLDNPNGVADGARIFLMAGDHPTYSQLDADGGWLGHTNTDHRFVTITAVPGAARGDVTITAAGGGGLRTKLIHLKAVTVRVSVGQSDPTNGDNAILWADDCHFIGAGRNDTTNFVAPGGYKAGVYVSDSFLESMNKGCIGTTLVRNNEIRDIAGDAILNVKMALNNVINDTGPLPGDPIHADIIQYFTVNPGLENIIIFNLHATNTVAQGWHIGYTGHVVGPLWRDFAFVNLILDMPSNFTAQWIPSADHVLWWNLTVPDGRTIIRNNPTGGVTSITNFDMRHCVFKAFSIRDEDVTPSLNDQSWATKNHYVDTTTFGATTPGDDFTTGGSKTSLFVDASQSNYEAKPGSVLVNRLSGSDLIVPVDALGREITQFPAAIGALQRQE